MEMHTYAHRRKYYSDSSGSVAAKCIQRQVCHLSAFQRLQTCPCNSFLNIIATFRRFVQKGIAVSLRSSRVFDSQGPRSDKLLAVGSVLSARLMRGCVIASDPCPAMAKTMGDPSAERLQGSQWSGGRIHLKTTGLTKMWNL